MRRSLNSNKSVLLIIMVAVFTLISYFFDQMVIRQEDNLRNNQIKLENLNVKIDTLTSVSDQLTTLQESVWIKYITLKRQRNFWFKSLLMLTNYDSYPFLTNKELQATFDDKKFIDQYIKVKFIRYFRDTIVAHYEIDDSFYNIVSLHTDDLFPEFIISENNQNVVKSILINFEDTFFELSKIIHVNDFDKYFDLSKYKNRESREKIAKEFSLKNWSDLHKFNYAIVNKFENYLDIIEPQYNKIEKQIVDEEEIRNKTIEKISNLATRKNYYILSSIISQILSLLFLLILFKAFVQKKKIV